MSVVIPVFNGAQHLGETVRSILEQTHKVLEIIIVDDGSLDDSATLAESLIPATNVIRQQRGGAAKALNIGIARTSGDLVALLDQDDLWVKDKIEHQVNALDGDSALDGVFGQVQQFISPDASAETRATMQVPNTPQPGPCASTLLVRRAALERVGPFRGVGAMAFSDWYVRAQAVGVRFLMPDYLVTRRRVHDSNSTRTDRDTLAAHYLELARMSVLAKRRPIQDDQRNTSR